MQTLVVKKCALTFPDTEIISHEGTPSGGSK
jgi:hypothetical protein